MKVNGSVRCYDAIRGEVTCRLMCDAIEKSGMTKRINFLHPGIRESWMRGGGGGGGSRLLPYFEFRSRVRILLNTLSFGLGERWKVVP